MPIEVFVHKGPRTEIVESPIPTPDEHQVVIKVVVSGCNPKDWKLPQLTGRALNEGDDIAGIVHQVGKNVTEFKVCIYNRGLHIAATDALPFVG